MIRHVAVQGIEGVVTVLLETITQDEFNRMCARLQPFIHMRRFSQSGCLRCLCGCVEVGAGPVAVRICAGALTCKDIDECDSDSGGNDCHADAMCMNSDGGFTCTCKDGYSRDGTTCGNANSTGDGRTAGRFLYCSR